MTKALSVCEIDNITEQLSYIKHNIIFEKNGFQWKSADKKQVKCTYNIDKLNLNTSSIFKIISKSICSGTSINLSEFQCFYGKTTNFIPSKSFGQKDFQLTDDGEITMVNTQSDQSQQYISYELNPSSKYRLRFRFNNHPSQYVVVGVFPLSQISTQYQYNLKNHCFSKRFKCLSATLECSRVIKGTDLSSSTCFTDQKIEIQVDFVNNYMDFSDFPDHKNVNANLLTSKLLKEPYVFTFNLDQTSSIIVESLEEISSLDEYYLKEKSKE